MGWPRRGPTANNGGRVGGPPAARVLVVHWIWEEAEMVVVVVVVVVPRLADYTRPCTHA